MHITTLQWKMDCILLCMLNKQRGRQRETNMNGGCYEMTMMSFPLILGEGKGVYILTCIHTCE